MAKRLSAAVLAALAGCWLAAAGAPAAAQTAMPTAPPSGQRQEVQARECFTYGDDLSLNQARQEARDMAARRAVAQAAVSVAGASVVEDMMLVSQTARSLTAGTLRDRRVSDETAEGRTVCATVSGWVDPAQVARAIADLKHRQAVAAGPSDLPERQAPRDAQRCVADYLTRLTVRERLAPGGALSEMRARLLDQAKLEAVSATLGAMIRGGSKSTQAVINDKVDEAFLQRFRAQARGQVAAQVRDERVVSEGGQSIMELVVDARVCEPRKDQLKPLVAVAATLSTRGEHVPELRQALVDAFAEGGAYVVVPGDDFGDYVVSAEVVEVKVLPHSFTLGTRRTDGHRVVAAVAARASEGGEVVASSSLEEEALFPGTRDPADVAEELVKGMMPKLAADLRRRLMAATGVGKAAAAAPRVTPSPF